MRFFLHFEISSLRIWEKEGRRYTGKVLAMKVHSTFLDNPGHCLRDTIVWDQNIGWTDGLMD